MLCPNHMQIEQLHMYLCTLLPGAWPAKGKRSNNCVIVLSSGLVTKNPGDYLHHHPLQQCALRVYLTVNLQLRVTGFWLCERVARTYHAPFPWWLVRPWERYLQYTTKKKKMTLYGLLLLPWSPRFNQELIWSTTYINNMMRMITLSIYHTNSRIYSVKHNGEG